MPVTPAINKIRTIVSCAAWTRVVSYVHRVQDTTSPEMFCPWPDYEASSPARCSVVDWFTDWPSIHQVSIISYKEIPAEH